MGHCIFLSWPNLFMSLGGYLLTRVSLPSWVCWPWNGFWLSRHVICRNVPVAPHNTVSMVIAVNTLMTQRFIKSPRLRGFLHYIRALTAVLAIPIRLAWVILSHTRLQAPLDEIVAIFAFTQSVKHSELPEFKIS